MRYGAMAASMLLLPGCLATPPDRTADSRAPTAGPAPLDRTPAIAEGLAAQWTFDEGSAFALAASGSCGSACDGTIRGIVEAGALGPSKGSGWLQDASAHSGRALYLDGDDDHVLIADDDRLVHGWAEITVIARLRRTEWARGTGDTVLSTGQFGPDGPIAVWFGIDEQNRLAAEWGHDLGANQVVGPEVAPGGWHHVAWTYRADGDSCVYVDGERGPCAAADGPLLNPTAPIVLGGTRHYSAVANDRMLCGALDVVRVYYRALDADQIRADAEALRREGTSPAGAECAPTGAGCADGSVEGLADRPGIAACDFEGFQTQWGPGLDTAACAPGWHVCSIAEVVWLTPNRTFAEEELPGRYALNQNGCADVVPPPWVEQTLWSVNSRNCEYGPPQCGSTPEKQADARGVRLGVDLAGPQCTGNVTACGHRSCRGISVALDKTLGKGVACCAEACRL